MPLSSFDLLQLAAIVAVLVVAALVVKIRSAAPSSADGGDARAHAGKAASPIPGVGSEGMPPPLPTPPDPRPLLRPGMHAIGQLWRWDGHAWAPQLAPDVDPMRAIVSLAGVGVFAIAWDAVERRDGARWVQEHRSPNGRPRLCGVWAHPAHGAFVGGDRGTVLRRGGDGRWSPIDVMEEARKNVVYSIWGDDEVLFLGLGDGSVAVRRGDTWTMETTPSKDVLFHGTVTARGVFACSQDGLLLRRDEGGAWAVEHRSRGAVHQVIEHEGELWAASDEGVLRSSEAGAWRRDFESGAQVVCLASRGGELWAGDRSGRILQRDGAGVWRATARGRAGAVNAIGFDEEGALLVGTEDFVEVA